MRLYSISAQLDEGTVSTFANDSTVEKHALDARRLTEPFWTQVVKELLPVQRFAEKIVEELLDRAKVSCGIMLSVARPQPYQIHDVLNLLRDSGPGSALLSEARTNELVEAVRPYIYGGTPLCRALNDLGCLFVKSPCKQKLLFILSDGDSKDGAPTALAEYLKRNHGVIVVSCFLTGAHIPNPRRMYAPNDTDILKQFDSAAKTMFTMSSSVSNSNKAMKILEQLGWELSSSGESCLFLQANHPDIVREYMKLFSRLLFINDVPAPLAGAMDNLF